MVDRLQTDASPAAFASIVDELLDSPRYGERWARHWLDLARFGESQGFERDKSRPNSWRYRDWVINALNDDMPYNEFARMQLAGDVMPEARREGVIATGFLVAGPWDEVGQNQQSAAMKAVVRQDEMEDYVGTVGQTFLGLTTNCARCHDHKFDPIRQSEYYALSSALDGVRHGDRDITPPEIIEAAKKRSGEVRKRLKSIHDEMNQIRKPAERAVIAESKKSGLGLIRQPIAHWDFDEDLKDRFGMLHGEAKGGAVLEDGALVVDGKKAHVVTKPLNFTIREKTFSVRVTLDNLQQRGGGVMSLYKPRDRVFEAIVFGEREPGKWMRGSEFFRRSRDVDAAMEVEADQQPVHLAISMAIDGTTQIYRNGKPYGSAYHAKAAPAFGSGDWIAFGIRLFPVGGNRMLAGKIHEASLYDRALDGSEMHALAQGAEFVTEQQIVQQLSPAQRQRLGQLKKEADQLGEMDLSIRRESTYAIKPSQPKQPVRLLLRGNPATPGDVVAPKGIESIKGLRDDFGLPADGPESERRLKLAEWITHQDNPLFARVIVNRIWHHHFGVGFVNTPNDFGFTGGRPTHPELLDYLASRLIESGWSLKAIHRMIVSSEAWQQATIENEHFASQDAENRLLWRGSRIRLDAETLRDSMLSVSGQLNETRGGPSYQDFKTFNFNSQFYEMLDPAGREFNRRTIYRMIIRSGRNRMLDAFDCPDPSATAPKRSVTTTPLQSLSLMNHSFVLRMADHFAARTRSEVGDDIDDQIDRVVRLAWCRSPSDSERDLLKQFVTEHDLASLCRVIFNSNEFLYVD